MKYNADLFRQIFNDSLEHLGLRLSKATDWINSRLDPLGIEYSYNQLYRFSRSGDEKAYSRRSLDTKILRSLVEIEFFWNKEDCRHFSQKEIETLLFTVPPSYQEPQLSLLELAEIEELKDRMSRLSPVGRSLLAPEFSSVGALSVCDKLAKSSITSEKKGVSQFTEQEFYRLKNWLTESLNILGRPGQPRTAAQENGFEGRIGENLNLLLEGDRNILFSKEDYIASSFVLLKIKGWRHDLQPIIFTTSRDIYKGDWQGVILDLRRPNGQPTTSTSR